jgi:hypothetical protein
MSERQRPFMVNDNGKETRFVDLWRRTADKSVYYNLAYSRYKICGWSLEDSLLRPADPHCRRRKTMKRKNPVQPQQEKMTTASSRQQEQSLLLLQMANNLEQRPVCRWSDYKVDYSSIAYRTIQVL